jgi:hypothetical protein
VSVELKSSLSCLLLRTMTKSFSILLSLGSHIIQRQKEPTKAHQIKLDVVVKALKWLEIDMDVDEVP